MFSNLAGKHSKIIIGGLLWFISFGFNNLKLRYDYFQSCTASRRQTHSVNAVQCFTLVYYTKQLPRLPIECNYKTLCMFIKALHILRDRLKGYLMPANVSLPHRNRNVTVTRSCNKAIDSGRCLFLSFCHKWQYCTGVVRLVL
jgi:hypothetical protein